MDVNYPLSPVNFPSESSPLPSPGIELTLFLGISLDLTNAFIPCAMCPWGRSAKRPKRCDKHGDKYEDNSPKNVNNAQYTCCRLQIRPVEEQLKQRVIGER